MTFTAWLSLASICIMGAVSPGPSLAVVMRHTVCGSRQHGMATGLAHSLGVGFYALLTVSGLAALFALEPTLQQILAVGGGAYLAWLGVNALRSKGHLVQDDSPENTAGIFSAARDGLMISILNPKLMIFFLALFSQFVEPDISWTAGLLMVLTATLIDGSWYCLVATVLSRKSYLAKLKKHSLLIDRTTGVILLILAARVFTL